MKKKNDIFAETIVGIFMAAVLALLVYFTIVISGMDILIGRTKVPIRVEFTDVGGLKDRDSVMYRGMKVGVIDRIDLSKTNVTMVVRVDNDVVLRENYRISVASLSLLGGNYLLLEEGTGEPLPLETTLFRGEPPTDWMRDIGRIASSVGNLTSDGGIKSIVTNIEAVAAKLNAVATRIEKGEGTVGKLLSSDETVYQDLKASLANVRDVTAKLKDGNGLLGKLTSDEKLASDASAMIEKLAAASTDLATVASRLEKGEGTLGKLSADSKLYDEVTALLKDVRQIVDNYRDTTPISTFGSLIGGAL